MNKEQFLAMSLPHGLMIQVHREDGLDVIKLNASQYYLLQEGYHFDDYKPIVHPLSDLTKNEFSFIYEDETDFESIEQLIMMDFESFLSNKFSFYFWQELIKNHFDLANLIGKGEAIDVNTLQTNPYA